MFRFLVLVSGTLLYIINNSVCIHMARLLFTVFIEASDYLVVCAYFKAESARVM